METPPNNVVALPSKRVVDELERIKVQMRKEMRPNAVIVAHAESETRIGNFIAACKDKDTSQRLFQRLLLLSIIDAYYKGRFDE